MSEESRVSVDGIACASMQEFWDTDRAGAFHIIERAALGDDETAAKNFPAIWLKVPAPGGGCELARLPLNSANPNDVGARWDWDGNREIPTLTPSIHCRGIWHGFLRAGRFESC